MAECIDCGVEFEKYQWNQKRCYDCIEASDPRFKQRPRKTCPQCNTEFQPRTVRHTYCTEECGREAHAAGYYKRTYGLSDEEYRELFIQHDHRCAICGEEGFRMNSRQKNTLCVDHCHKTNKVRGLLCNNCNRALGLLQDDKQRLQSAIEYLEGSETIRKE